MSFVLIYILAAVIGGAAFLLLDHYAKLKAREKLGEKERDTSTDESLRSVIAEEINEIVDSESKSQEASKRIVKVFSDELKKREERSTEKVDEKYNKLVDEKTKSEERAWKQYEKVLANKKETEAVIRSVAEGLVVVDARGKVVMMNPTAEKLIGSSKKEKLGKSITQDLRKEEVISLAKDSPVKDGSKEIEIMGPDEETKKVIRSSSAVIEDENGQTVGMVSVLTDITKQRELDEMKENFVSNVTHELRTPLIAVQKALRLLINREVGKITKEQEEFLNIADRNLKKLSRLIDDLLDLSKLEAGKMSLDYQNISVERLIGETVEGLKAWAKTKSIGLEKKVEGGLPEIMIDAKRVSQVLNNLIGNAVKFTPNNGTITIDARLTRDNKRIAVSVADTGPGIPKDDLDKIFDKFSQSKNKSATNISGTGIGLAVAKEVVDLHGGEIWAENNPGGGARFCFTIPIKSGG